MARTKLALHDGDQILLLKADELLGSAFSYIRNDAGKLKLGADSGQPIYFASALKFDAGLNISSSGGALSIGQSGDTVNLNVSGVTYNLSSITSTLLSISGNLTVSGSGTNNIWGTTVFKGDVIFDGTNATLNALTLTVDDKNIELGSVTTPTDVTADGGGITLKGATDKTLIWDNANDNWTSSEHWNLATGKLYKINNTNLFGFTDPYTVSYQNLRITNTSTTNTTRFLVEGNNGQLFAIVDDLSDSLLSVNDISGLPILEVFAADKVVMGKFGSNTLVVNSESVGIGTATPAAKLHIVSTAAANGYLTFQGLAGGQGFGLNLLDSGGSAYIRILNDNNNLRIQTNAADHVINVKNAGSVGIGTESQHASNKLSVNGALAVGASYVSVAAPTNGLIVQGKSGFGLNNPTAFFHLRPPTGQTGFILNASDLGGYTAFSLENDAASYVFMSFSTNSTLRAYYGVEGSGGGMLTNSASNSLVINPRTGPLHIAYGTNATAGITLSTSNNVGIGIISSAAKLDILSTGAGYAGTPTLKVADSSARATFVLDSITDNPTDFILKNNNRLSWSISSRSSTNNYALNFYASTDGTSFGTTAMSITTAGNVGIGASSPDSKLDINGRMRVIGDSSNATSGFGVEIFQQGGTTAYIQAYDRTASTFRQLTLQGSPVVFSHNSTEVMRIHTNANIGIGTNSPSTKLHIYGTGWIDNTVGSGLLRLETTDNTGAGIAFKNANGNYWNIYNGGSSSWAGQGILGFVYSDGTTAATGPKMVLDTNGNLGINTISPNFKLDISGSVRIESANYLYFGGTGAADYDAYILSSGDILILNSDSSYMFRVAGGNKMQLTSTAIQPDTTGGFSLGSSSKQWNELWTTTIITSGGEGTYTAPSFGSTNLGAINIRSTTSDRRTGITFSSAALANAQAGIYVHQDNSAGTHMYFATTTSYAAGPQARITILNDGKVGIATTSPGAPLDVAGNIRSTGAGAAFNINTDGAYLGWGGANTSIVGAASGYLSLRTGDATSRIYIKSTGEVGIGTTTPNVKFEVNTGANTNIYLGRNADYTGYNILSLNGSAVDTGMIGLTAGGTGDGILYLKSTTDFYFTSNSATKFVIKNSGSVGIGTTAPNAKLEIYGVRTSQNTSVEALRISAFPADNQNYANNAYHIGFWDNSETGGVGGSNLAEAARITVKREEAWGALANRSAGLHFSTSLDGTLATRLSILANGNTGIGIDSPQTKLEVNGDIGIVYGSGSYKYGGNLVMSFPTDAVQFGQIGDFNSVNLGGLFGVNITNNPEYILGIGDYSADSNGTRIIVNDTLSKISLYGNVGIGTDTPSHRLSVYGGTVGYIGSFINDSNNGIYIGSAAAIANDYQYEFGIYDSATDIPLIVKEIYGPSYEYVNIHFGGMTYSVGNGNVGIAQGLPQYKLDVAGDINISAGSSYRIAGEPLTNESVIKKITQNSHGLSVGNAIRINSSGVYVKAQADSVANAEVVGIVQEVVDANTFKVVFSGMVTAGVPAQPPGTVLFLSDSSAGALSTSEPNTFGKVSKPVAVVTSSGSAMVVINMRGMEIAEDDALGEYFDITNVSNPTFTAGNLDNVILCDCTNNEIIVNLPSAVDNQGKIFYIKKIDSSLNDAVVTPINGELIDDYVTYPLELRGEYVQIISNNVNWMILSD